MLRRGTKRIVVVNTVTKEDSQKYVLDWGHWYQKEYFEELFRIVQKNKHGIRGGLPIIRYTDLNDVQKCEEAISLLMYGSDVRIYDSAIPIEFLIRDDEQVLLGFPEENELSHGVQIKSKDVCATLNRWIADQSGTGLETQQVPVRETKDGPVVAIEYSAQPAPVSGGFTDPQSIAQRIREKGKNKPLSEHSLIHALGLLAKMNVTDPVESAGKAFDTFDDWYPDLYNETECDPYYKILSDYLKSLMKKEHPTFLDVGCAHGLGAQILENNGLQYWGVDVSNVLLERAKHRLRHGRTFILGDMVRVLLEPSQREPLFGFYEKANEHPSLPARLDVIACQGNTFDFFLGDLQKWFAFTLFRSRLKQGGILFVTQRSFTKGEGRVERKLPKPGGVDTVVYDLEWSGDFVKIDVQAEGRSLGSVIQHPTDATWLRETCVKAGFTFVDDVRNNIPKWFGPRGGKAYEVFVFQKTE